MGSNCRGLITVCLTKLESWSRFLTSALLTLTFLKFIYVITASTIPLTLASATHKTPFAKAIRQSWDHLWKNWISAKIKPNKCSHQDLYYNNQKFNYRTTKIFSNMSLTAKNMAISSKWSPNLQKILVQATPKVATIRLRTDKIRTP